MTGPDLGDDLLGSGPASIAGPEPDGAPAPPVSAVSAVSAVEPIAGLTRDELTRTGYSVLAVWAWFLYGFGAVLPLLRAEQNTSRTVMGLHSLALASGGLVAGFLLVPLVRTFRRRGSFAIGIGLLAVGVLALSWAPVTPLTLAATLITGTGGSLVVTLSVTALSDHHAAGGPTALSEGNAVAAGLGLIAPLAVGAAEGLGWTWRPAMLLLLPMLAALTLLLRRVPTGTPAMDAGLPPRDGVPRPLPRRYWVLLCLVMACVGIEFCCTAWSADLLRQRTGLAAGAASAGVTAVVGGMAVGRVVIGRLALRYSPRWLLLGALVLTVVGWTITWLSTDPAPAMVGLAVIGLGIAGHFPLGAALLLAAVPGQTDQASGRMSLGIAVASGSAPFALGAVADATSTHAAFLAVPLLVAAATVALAASGRGERPVSSGPARDG